MIKINIREVAEAKHFENAHQLQLAATLAPHVAQRLWRGEVEKISMETLNRLCRALECQPGDLFIYEFYELAMEPDEDYEPPSVR